MPARVKFPPLCWRRPFFSPFFETNFEKKSFSSSFVTDTPGLPSPVFTPEKLFFPKPPYTIHYPPLRLFPLFFQPPLLHFLLRVLVTCERRMAVSPSLQHYACPATSATTWARRSFTKFPSFQFFLPSLLLAHWYPPVVTPTLFFWSVYPFGHLHFRVKIPSALPAEVPPHASSFLFFSLTNFQAPPDNSVFSFVNIFPFLL